jgi:hypothetical protein
MHLLKKTLLALSVVVLLPTAALAASTSLTWDGSYITDPSQMPEEFASLAPGTGPRPRYAKLSFNVTANCPAGYYSTKIAGWDRQHSQGVAMIANAQCITDSGNCPYDTNYAEIDHQQASLTYDMYVRPGVPYVLSGTQVCYAESMADPYTIRICQSAEAGGEDAKCHSWHSSVIEVPPVLSSVNLSSSKTYKYFNKFKVGETLKISDFNTHVPESNYNPLPPVQQWLVVEGPGIEKREYRLKDLMRDEITDITPTEPGTMTLKIRTMGYIYYMDHWHGSQYDDWTYTNWLTDYPELDGREEHYTQETLYSSEKCTRIIDANIVNDPSDDVLCPGYGEPVYRAELFDLISEPLEIPVENDWCIKPTTGIGNYHANPTEGCHSCSAGYSENMYWFEVDELCNNDASGNDDAGGNGSDNGNDDPTDKPGKKDDESSGCSATGVASLASLMGLALIPALKRRRKSL